MDNKIWVIEEGKKYQVALEDGSLSEVRTMTKKEAASCYCVAEAPGEYSLFELDSGEVIWVKYEDSFGLEE